jgi:flagellar L-ring protein precursor FlgH
MRRALLVLVALAAVNGCARRRLPEVEPPPVMAPPAAPMANGSLWRAERADNYPFLDVRAHFPGDLLTVVINERAEGAKEATTDTAGESSISASVDEFFGIPAAAVKLLPRGFQPEMIVQAETARESHGEGETTRTGRLTGSIAVTVVAIDPNGNLRVRGEKIVRVNREDQHIALTGTVRPEDIASDNSILSSRIADARIDYYGRGVLGDKQNVPLVHRLWDWIWPF